MLIACPPWSHGHSCDHVTVTYAFEVQYLRLASTRVKTNKYRSVAFSSFAYTQTIDCLYPNDRAPIPNLKHIFSCITKHFRENRQKVW